MPGCHASGFIALVAPLVEEGLLSPDAPLSCTSLTGYSGGGKKMIADYEQKGAAYDPPRPYGLAQAHKHLPEMTQIARLAQPPVFLPVVGNFYSGMLVSVPLHRSQLRFGAGMEDVRSVYKKRYAGPVVAYRETISEGGFASAGLLSGKDGMYIACEGNGERFTLLAAYDNLGKGASGRGGTAFKPENGRGYDRGPGAVMRKKRGTKPPAPRPRHRENARRIPKRRTPRRLKPMEYL